MREALLRVAGEDARVLAAPPPAVLFLDFGESSLDFVLLVWIPDPLLEPAVTSDLRFAIDSAFRAERIEIPFPQRDLHIRTGAPGLTPGHGDMDERR